MALGVATCIAVAGLRGDGSLTYVGQGDHRFPVVVVRGTPYEMGKKLGELTKRCGRVHSHGPGSRPGQRSATVLHSVAGRRLEDDRAAHRFALPRRTARAGRGDGTLNRRVTPCDTLPVISDYSCSSIAAWGKATKNGHLYQTRNLDWELHLTAQDHPVIAVYIPSKGIPHVNISFAGVIGSNTGMNARGIVLSEIGDSPGREYPYNINGTHFTTLFRTVLYDADSLERAVSIFQSADRIKKYHFVVGDGLHHKAVKMRATRPTWSSGKTTTRPMSWPRT